MSLSSLKFLFVLMGSLLLLNPLAGMHRISGGGSVANQDTSSVRSNFHEKMNRSTGYRAIIRNGDGFLAAGSEGRIDWISASGMIVKSENIAGENFNCLISDNQRTIVAGDHGSMLISSEKGTFQKVNSGTEKNINSIALFKGMIIAGTDEGGVLSGNGKGSFSMSYPAVKGNIVSLSARESDCFGATDEGEIIHTTDGINWDVFDFNEVYAGYYKPCSFTKILVTEQQIAVAGIRNDGSPVLMFSNQGNVWSERTLNYIDEQGMQGYLAELPNDIFYDNSRDLFFLACDKGNVMQIPSCSHCNKLAQLSSENLSGISGDGNTLMIVGTHFYSKTINPE